MTYGMKRYGVINTFEGSTAFEIASDKDPYSITAQELAKDLVEANAKLTKLKSELYKLVSTWENDKASLSCFSDYHNEELNTLTSGEAQGLQTCITELSKLLEESRKY